MPATVARRNMSLSASGRSPGLRVIIWICRLPMREHSGWMTNLNSIHRCGGSVGINSIVAMAPTSRFTPFIEKMSGAPDAGGARLGGSCLAVKQRI